jgi:hypothetical protein
MKNEPDPALSRSSNLSIELKKRAPKSRMTILLKRQRIKTRLYLANARWIL